MKLTVVIAGCVDPLFIYSFLGAVGIAVICGFSSLFIPRRARVPTSAVGLAFSIIVFSILVSDGLFRGGMNLFSGLMAFGPALLNSIALTLALRSKP